MTKKAKLISQIGHERLVLQEHVPLVTPWVIYIEPSGYCNLKCNFCPQGIEEHGLKKNIMLLDLFKKLIGDIAEFPEKIRLIRVCGNGDPLTNKNLVAILEHAKTQKVSKKMELVTNGILLTDDLIENLPRFVDRIVISIEGISSADYQKTCNTKVNFQELVDKIKVLYAARKGCVLHIKIHNEAVPTTERKQIFLDLFSKYCDEIYIEQLVPMWPQLNIDRVPDKFRWGGELVRHQVCAQIFKGVQVQADGEVVPCCVDWKRVNVLGNINENSLREIWNGERLRTLQIEHLLGNKSKIEPCKDCAMNDYCEIDNIDAYAEECIRRLKQNDNSVVK